MIDDITPPSPKQRAKLKPTETVSKAVQPAAAQSTIADDTNWFLTPEEVSVRERPRQDVPKPADAGMAAGKHEPGKKQHRFRFEWPRTRRQRILAGAAVVLVAFGVGAGWTLTHHKRTVQAVTSIHVATPKKTATPIIVSKLTGLPVASDSVNQRPVTGVMIENSVDARPQSGLSQAGVVFEAVAEGGVTRFLALYQDQQPTNVGPIRSARPYYVAWDMGFDAAYAHVGGSTDALNDIAAWGTKDMNQFYNGNYYHRITSREAPHNVYTGLDTLAALETSKGYTTSTYTGFARKQDDPYKAPAATATATTGSKGKTVPADTRTPATSIDFSLSGYTYDPHYDYNAATNSYSRSEAGTPQLDANTGAQLSPKVVIAIVVPESQGALDSSGAYYSNYNVIGSGQMYVFQDGTVTTGTWSKSGNRAQLTFSDANGAPLKLDPGQTWISAVTNANKVTYQ